MGVEFGQSERHLFRVFAVLGEKGECLDYSTTIFFLVATRGHKCDIVVFLCMYKFNIKFKKLKYKNIISRMKILPLT